MTGQSLPDSTRAVLNIAFKIGVALGRKFEASDMTPELRQAARMYAASYEGDFDYMLDMRARLVAGIGAFFSDVQNKAILNCLMADAKRRLADRAPAIVQASPAATAPQTHVTLKNVPDGRYRVTLPSGEHLALKATLAGRDSKLEGSRVVSTRINGDEWMGVAHISPAGDLRLWRSCTGALRDRVRDAVNVLDTAERQEDWLIAGLAFAQEGSQCFICGRDLDTPESLTAGYGPVCADKHGLPWGAKAIPMSVRLAQAEAVASAPVIDPETGVEETAEELLALAAAAAATAPAPSVAPVAYIPKEYKEDPALTADRARFAAAKAQARAEGRRMTYEECFGEDSI